MSDLGPLREAIAAAMATGDDPAGQVCQALVAALPVDGGEVTAMASDAARERLCASDDTIARLADLEFTLGEGPCLQAFEAGAPVLIPDLAATTARWPVFATAAGKLPVGGLFVFPVQLGAITVGVCELYRTEPGPLEVEELALVLGATDLAALALLRLRTGGPVAEIDGYWLDGSPAERVVHQATGMLITQLGVPAEEAFARLRGHAFSHDRMVGEIAGDIVARRLRLEADSG